MIEAGQRSAVLVYQRESRARNVLLRGRFERGGDALDEGRLSCTQIAAKQDQLWRREEARQRSPKGDRFFGRVGGDLACRHADSSYGTSIARVQGPERSR